MADDLIRLAKFAQMGEEIAQEVEKETKKIADEGVKDLRNASEQFTKYGHGKYAKGWRVTRQDDSYVINNKDYRLPHLLEYPHPIIAYGKQVSYWTGKAHIKPVEEKIVKQYEDDVEKLIDKEVKKI